ncbi:MULTISPECIES: ROK family protein [Streptomyces]|uniref:ROK family protein n=1 Tax=Streptomyces solicathayae TaxID=3081768 RepID=A0ABZ0LMR9_9ACTN|nr:ROK family protein [Streptomyces sp. HUAS YS2]WOX20787.1 ROK family protein [Streptomyces sp. HUAS YS2]
MPDAPAASDCVIALDVGGTGMKGAVLDRTLTPLETLRRPTPRSSGPDAVVDAIAAALCGLRDHAEARGLTVRSAGAAVPGIVDEAAGRALHSANIGWSDLPLAALLGEATGLPVALGHDVRAGGIAECRIGAARGALDALFVPVGTGIAAAILCDGRPVRGLGHAGELGHVVAEPGGARCACGSRGCLETVASAAAVAAAYTERSGRPVDGAARVAALVARGDPVAVAVWDRAVDALASALATVSTLLAPGLVVIGGGLAEAGDLLIEPLRDRLHERLTFQRGPDVVRARLGDRAGCLGAGILAWEAAGSGPMAVGTEHGIDDEFRTTVSVEETHAPDPH